MESEIREGITKGGITGAVLIKWYTISVRQDEYGPETFHTYKVRTIFNSDVLSTGKLLRE